MFISVGIRNFIISATVKVTSDEALLRREKLYVNKLNLVLIQVSFVGIFGASLMPP